MYVHVLSFFPVRVHFLCLERKAFCFCLSSNIEIMKKNDLAEIYRMWGGDIWPRGFLSSTVKQVADVVDRDTVFHHPDILVVGGDPVTRFFALRALSRRHAGASILITPPRHPSESFAPWLQEESHLKWFKERFGFESYEVFFKKMSQTAIPHLLEHANIRQTRKFAMVSSERSLMVLKDRGSFDDAWDEWHHVETLSSGLYEGGSIFEKRTWVDSRSF